MLDSSNNQNVSRTQRSPFFNLSLSSRLRRTTPRSGSRTQTISKRSLMPSGTLSTRSSIRLSNLELRSFSPTFQLVTLLPNTLPTETFSAREEYKKMISLELLKLLEPFFKQPSMDLPRTSLDSVASSRRFRLVMRDSTCSLSA